MCCIDKMLEVAQPDIINKRYFFQCFCSREWKTCTLVVHVCLCLGCTGDISVKDHEIPLINCDSNVYSYICLFSAAPPAASPLMPGASCALPCSIPPAQLWYTLINLLCWHWKGVGGFSRSSCIDKNHLGGVRDTVPTRAQKIRSNNS